MRSLIVADMADQQGGLIVERLRSRGSAIELVDRMKLAGFAGAEPVDLVVLLGAPVSIRGRESAVQVGRESRFVRDALSSGVPVMATGYGSQLLARALGGTTFRLEEPELGWRRVDTIDPVLCPEGPWAQFHNDAFIAPPSARVLGSSRFGQQCFVDETRGARVIAWQFHPEVRAETYAMWISQAESAVRTTGADPDQLRRAGYERGARVEIAAFDLTDSALEYLQVKTGA